MNPSIALPFPVSVPSLRDLLEPLLPQGYAQCVQPICATAITTDGSDLNAGETRIPTKQGEIPGYGAMPNRPGKYPVVLVVQEIFGVHEHIKDVCRRLAKLGYMAVAPELFHRQADVSSMSREDIRDKVVPAVPDAQVMADLDATLAFVEKTGYADMERVAIAGYCWGGRITWLYAAHNPKLKCGIAWYGRMVGQGTKNQPHSPEALAPKLGCPVLGLYGEKDEGIPPETVYRMREALAKAGKYTSEIHLYPDAPHAFFADYRPSYRKEPAEDAWKRMLAWLALWGVKP